MAISLNKVFLVGNLTRDPDIRSTNKNVRVGELSLAVNRRTKEGDETCYIDVVVWDKTAELCQRLLTKGSQIMVEGRLANDQWTDKSTGLPRRRHRVVAEQVNFISRIRSNNEYNEHTAEGDYNNQYRGYGSSSGYSQNGSGFYPQPQPRSDVMPRMNQSNMGQNPPMPRMDQPDMGQNSMPRMDQSDMGQNPPMPRMNQLSMPTPESMGTMPPTTQDGANFNPDGGLEEDIPF